MNATKMHSNTVKASHAPRMKKIALIRKLCFIEFVPIMPNILVMGRAAFMRVPVSEASDINYLLCFLFFDDGFDVAN